MSSCVKCSAVFASAGAAMPAEALLEPQLSTATQEAVVRCCQDLKQLYGHVWREGQVAGRTPSVAGWPQPPSEDLNLAFPASL